MGGKAPSRKSERHRHQETSALHSRNDGRKKTTDTRLKTDTHRWAEHLQFGYLAALGAATTEDKYATASDQNILWHLINKKAECLKQLLKFSNGRKPCFTSETTAFQRTIGPIHLWLAKREIEKTPKSMTHSHYKHKQFLKIGWELIFRIIRN